MDKAELVKVGFGSWLAGAEFRAELGTAGFGAAFCRAGFREKIGHGLGRAAFWSQLGRARWLGTVSNVCLQVIETW